MKRNKKKSQAITLSFASIAVNILLSVLKLAAGLLGNSQALVADAVHSASDVLSTVIVLVSLMISGKGPDADHEYGHQKYESLASLFLAILLGYVGIKLGMNGLKSIISSTNQNAAIPSVLTAAAALLSVIVKEAMYHATMKVARAEKSNALKADAWHHRSDALSSIGSMAGVLFARLGLPVMDPAASLIISIFILKTALEIILDAMKALTDSACDKQTEQAIKETALSVTDIDRVDELKTRVFGSGYYVDIEISVSGQKTLEEAHILAEQVHDRIEESFSDVWHCMVHVNPD